VAKVWREDFEGDGTVESDLAGEIDGTHAAATEEGGDFEFGEEGREVGGRGRTPVLAWDGEADGRGFHAAFKEAARAEAGMRGGGQRCAAGLARRLRHVRSIVLE
jgi:hypothetical protein